MRPLNTLDGRDVIELEESSNDECDDERSVDNDDNEMKDEWLWKRWKISETRKHIRWKGCDRIRVEEIWWSDDNGDHVTSDDNEY